MALQEMQLDSESFSCPICLDLLKDPVTLRCGHSFCMSCSNWGREDQGGIYSCPQCRQTFRPWPVLVMLADLVEQVKKIGLQAAPAGHCYAGPEDVACDVCTGRKRRALMSCSVCLASYCEPHLWPHLQSPGFKKHKLVEPNKKLQENVCSQHSEVMKMFRDTDQRCICCLCPVDEHKGHDTERQRGLGLRRQTIHQRLRDRQRDVELLQQEEEAANSSADKTVVDSEKTFTELIRLLQKRSSDVEQQIRAQQESEVSRVKELQERLEQEITELKREDDELEKLSHTEDPVQFLHNFPVLPLSDSTRSSSIRIRPLGNIEDVTAAVSQVRGQLHGILTELETLQVLSQPEPKTRADFLKYAQELTLDPNTAHEDVLLSERNRRVTLMRRAQSYSDHPHRFTGWPQVLSRESLTGRCYWEVEGVRGVGVAVAYKDIVRKRSNDSVFGHNDKSWGLYCYGINFQFLHNDVRSHGLRPLDSRVGVYLDHTAGVLSFYSVSDTMTLLRRVQTTFTQPLYAGVAVYCSGTTAELCELKKTGIGNGIDSDSL